MASSTARSLLKNGKSFSHTLRNPLLGRPNPQLFQSLTNPTPHKLYLQRPIVFKEGLHFVDFVRGKPSSDFNRMEAARVKKQPVSDEDESGDEYYDEVNIAEEDIEDLFSGGDEKKEDDDDDGGGGGGGDSS